MRSSRFVVGLLGSLLLVDSRGRAAEASCPDAPGAPVPLATYQLDFDDDGDQIQLAAPNAAGKLVELLSAHAEDWSSGEWHHLLMTWLRLANDTTRVHLFLDGRLAARVQTAVFPAPPTPTGTLYLLSSNRAGDPSPAAGRFAIDSFRSYDVELTQSQVIALYGTELDRSGPTVRAGRLGLGLLGAEDGFGLSHITDTLDCTVKTMAAPSRQLWQVRLQSATGPFRDLLIDNTAALGHRLTSVVDPTQDAVELEWRNIDLPDLSYGRGGGGTLSVRVRLTPDRPDDAVRGQVEARLSSAVWSLAEIVFPRLGGIAPPRGDAARTDLVFPGKLVGTVLSDPFTTELLARRYTYPSRFLSMQFAGLIDREIEKGGLYVAAYDGRASVKSFCFDQALPSSCPPPKGPLLGQSFRAVPNRTTSPLRLVTTDPGLDVAVVTYAHDIGQPDNSNRGSWEAILGIQDGSWYALARRYRDQFAVHQRWARGGPLSGRRYPHWMANAGLLAPVFGLDRGVSVAGALADELALAGVRDPGQLILVHLNKWQTAPEAFLAADMPFVSPAAGFETVVSTARSLGASIAPYFTPSLFDTVQETGDPWTALDGPRMAVLDEQGEPVALAEDSDPDFKPVFMCPASRPWRAVVREQLRSLSRLIPDRKTRMSGWYLDVMAATPPFLDGSTLHGHRPGGGSYWARGYRKMLTRLRGSLAGSLPDLGLYSENFGEPYIDLLDGSLTHNPGEESPLPLVHAVYHDYTQFLGRLFTCFDSVEAIIAKQGEQFAWGGMPGFPRGAFQFLDQPHADPVRPYLLKLARLRRMWQGFTVFGEMLAPVRIGWVGETPPGIPPSDRAPSGGVLPIPTNHLTLVTQGPAEGKAVLRKNICGGQDQEAAIVERDVPAVVSSTWRHPNKTAGVLVLSLEPAPVGQVRVVYVPVSSKDLGIVAPSVTVRTVNRDFPLGRIRSGFVRLEVHPEDVFLIHVGDNPGGRDPAL